MGALGALGALGTIDVDRVTTRYVCEELGNMPTVARCIAGMDRMDGRHCLRYGTDYCDSQGAFDTHFACKVVVVAGHSCRLVLQLENFEQFPLEEGSDL